jgi:hypothetical protein
MSIKLPELVDIDYTTLDFQGIIALANRIIANHPEYFSEVDDFTQGNAGRMTIELVSYIVSLLSERIDWVANELTLPTATQKQSVMNLLKFINYRLDMPKAASVNVRATINQYTTPFVIPARYTVRGRDRDGNPVRFEMLKKDEDGRYRYEGSGSGYEFNTGVSTAPILSHNDVPFYEGTSHRMFSTMRGEDNESIFLNDTAIEEGSIRVWLITRNNQGEIISRREIPAVQSYISPEAQSASDSGLPPYKIQPTETNQAYLVFGERPVVAIFSPNDEIMVWYRTTSGANGNIPRGGINYTTNLAIGGRTVQMSLVNTISGTGGAASETIEHAKRYGPLSITTVEKTVNPEDFIIILQRNMSLMNAIAYGKSNEPERIKVEYGHYIPPFETWIYPIFNKAGWETIPTSAYQQEFKLSRPYVELGLEDTEIIYFDGEQTNAALNKLKHYVKGGHYRNIIVSDFFNSEQYIPGADFVIDLEAREIVRLDGGEIDPNSAVIVQYYKNDRVGTDININFATGSVQDIPRAPVYPGYRTSAKRIDLQEDIQENDLSSRDYNHPTNDYRIDYTTGQIIKNPTYPLIESYNTLGEEVQLQSGTNNEMIISFDGLNKTTYNSDHDFNMWTYNGWAVIGSGNPVDFAGGTYYFKISIDGAEFEEYQVTLAATSYTPRELRDEIWNNAIRVSDSQNFNLLPVEVFADNYKYEASPRFTIMSKSIGPNSSVTVTEGTSGTSIFVANFSTVEYGSGEVLDIYGLAQRMRFTLNSMSLCFGYAGQELAAGEEEKPEIYPKSDIINYSSFSLGSTNNSLDFEISGTNLATYDGTHTVVFDTVEANTYDLTAYQDVLDLVEDMQYDVDQDIAQNVIEVIWIRAEDTYRVGFRLVDTGGTAEPYIKIKDPSTNSARVTFQYSPSQVSTGGNLVEARVSNNTDFVDIYKVAVELFGGFGEDALLQVKANDALHNNTLDVLQFGDNQTSRGSKILIRTLPGQDDLISDFGLLYEFKGETYGSDQNNLLEFTITGAPSGYPDESYVVTIPEGTYNIDELVDAINVAFETSDATGTTYDISTFLTCEKQEGAQRLRFLMTDFDSDSTPDVEVTNTVEEDITRRCVDKLGFLLGQKMSTYSSIILTYAGDWISDRTQDQSEEAQILDYLSDKRLISQDYKIKDSRYTSFDIKGKVYCAKGFDRAIIKENVKENIRNNFNIQNRDFRDPVAISNITKYVESVEGTVYTTVEFFGKDYQKYSEYKNRTKAAQIIASKPAENIKTRWSEKSAFKITVDGTAQKGGVNYDGEYLVVVGNDWTDRDYDSLLDAITTGTGPTKGMMHARPLQMGRDEVNLVEAVQVAQQDGIFRFTTQNEGPRVMLELDDPDDIFTYGYQSLSRQNNVLESEYVKSTTYSLQISIDGSISQVYSISSPGSGDWTLKSIASQLNNVLPVEAAAGIDSSNRIRITSMLGGSQSTVDISSTTANEDLVGLLDGIESPVDGSDGFVSCLDPEESGTLYIDTPQTSYGLEKEPTQEEMEDMFNYKSEIPAKYNELLFVSDDYYSGEEEIENQTHGIILEFVELGSEDA